jgi:hypothetical protein
VFNFDASKLDWEDYLMRYAYGLRTYALNEKGLPFTASSAHTWREDLKTILFRSEAAEEG